MSLVKLLKNLIKAIEELTKTMDKSNKLIEEIAGPYCGHGEHFNICPWCKSIPGYPHSAV